MELKKFKVQVRNELGKNRSHRIRSKGLIPGIVYGKGKEEIPVLVNPHDLLKFLDPEKKRNTFFELEIEGKETTTVVVRDAQIEALTDKLLHVDFLRVSPEDMVKTMVPFKVVGRAEGVKMGGKLRQVVREMPIKAPASEIPAAIEYDVTPMKIGEILRVENLTPPEGVQLLMPARQALVIISAGRGAKVQTPGAAGEEAGA